MFEPKIAVQCPISFHLFWFWYLFIYLLLATFHRRNKTHSQSWNWFFDKVLNGCSNGFFNDPTFFDWNCSIELTLCLIRNYSLRFEFLWTQNRWVRGSLTSKVFRSKMFRKNGESFEVFQDKLWARCGRYLSSHTTAWQLLKRLIIFLSQILCPVS